MRAEGARRRARNAEWGQESSQLVWGGEGACPHAPGTSCAGRTAHTGRAWASKTCRPGRWCRRGLCLGAAARRPRPLPLPAGRRAVRPAPLLCSRRVSNLLRAAGSGGGVAAAPPPAPSPPPTLARPCQTGGGASQDASAGGWRGWARAEGRLAGGGSPPPPRHFGRSHTAWPRVASSGRAPLLDGRPASSMRAAPSAARRPIPPIQAWARGALPHAGATIREEAHGGRGHPRPPLQFFKVPPCGSASWYPLYDPGETITASCIQPA